MHDAENSDTLLAVAKENEDGEFEKLLLKYMVSSEIVNDILTKHSNYIYGAMRQLRTKMTKEEKKAILQIFYFSGCYNSFFNEKHEVCDIVCCYYCCFCFYLCLFFGVSWYFLIFVLFFVCRKTCTMIQKKQTEKDFVTE